MGLGKGIGDVAAGDIVPSNPVGRRILIDKVCGRKVGT